ncbi:MAG TPA: hypothetical protein PLI09_11180 [Candidatus Hydrogenedentes bacterium]|nr:hypothetical protein [Candidatus Hydrogenedentota bacterium]
MQSKSILLAVVALSVIGLTLTGCPKEPVLKISAGTMHFGVVEGPAPGQEQYETTKTFQVWNDGAAGTSVVFTVSATPAWIQVNPLTGQSLSADDKVTITVTIDRNYEAKSLDFVTGVVKVDAGFDVKNVGVTTAPNYYTEAFNNENLFDLDQTQLAFEPNGGPSFYGVEKSVISAFPTDPAGGLMLDFEAFGDPVLAMPFGGEDVPFYGKNYDTLYISSNGWVSFGQAGNDATSYQNHFKAPQISGLNVDATQAGSEVSFLQDEDKLIITYENCPTAGAPASPNDFQIELFFDGRIHLNYLNVDPAMQGVVGLSYGMGGTGALPDGFLESNLNTDTLKSN